MEQAVPQDEGRGLPDRNGQGLTSSPVSSCILQVSVRDSSWARERAAMPAKISIN